ncbi:hypothetical protein RQP46_004685 [Phenoliferia psychrophenolica]
MTPAPIVIPLATFSPDSKSSPPSTAGTTDKEPYASSLEPLSSKGKGENFTSLPPPISSYRKRHFVEWDVVEEVFWAAFALLLHLAGIAVLLYCILQTGKPYFTLKQVGGTGEANFNILNSCFIAPNTTARHCTSYSLNADFTPTLIAISPSLPGYSVMALPFRSVQSQAIFVTSLVLFGLSFLLFLPVWILFYFPRTVIVHARVTHFIRFYPKQFYELSGAAAFSAMVLAMSIGIGYRLLFTGYLDAFNSAQVEYAATLGGRAQVAAFLEGTVGADGASYWKGEFGKGFDLVYVAIVLMGLTAGGIQIAIHQQLHDKIERYGDDGSGLAF